jgi:hypothetical protein
MNHPAAGNLVFLVFFAASTTLLWHGGRTSSLHSDTPSNTTTPHTPQS